MKFTQRIRSLSKKAKLALALVTLTGVISVPFVANAGFFPDRPVFDYNKYNGNDDCNDPANIARDGGRCGSLNGPVFNSFINTPSYGDEREFLDGRRTDQAPAATADTVTDVTDGSKKVIIRMYVHNNANQNTNASGLGIARNTKVSVELPQGSGSTMKIVGAISADNATPKEVTDTMFTTGSRKYHLDYEEGSAKLLRGNASYPLSDSIVSGGAPIGNTAMDGNMPGCFEFAGLVELVVNIVPEENTNLQLVKEVQIKGEQGKWRKEAAVKPGARVQWRLGTKNIGLDQLTNVNVRDVLPPHVDLVPGSVRMIDATQDTVQNDAPLFGGGLGLGTYPSGGIRYIIFDTTTKDDFQGCSVRIRNLAYAKSTQTPTEVSDSSDVVITKENCQPITPTFSCDLLKAEVTNASTRTVKFTANASAAGGATISRYIYNFGDGTQELATDKSVVEHSYAKDGSYAARLKVEFKVGNKVEMAEGTQCAANVTFKQGVPPTTPTTPVTPGKLPETGAGDIIAMFIAVTATSSVGYFFVARRSIGL